MPVEPPLDTQELVQRAVQHQVRLPEYSQPVYIENAQSIDDLVSLAWEASPPHPEKSLTFSLNNIYCTVGLTLYFHLHTEKES
jgi:hypothetical protein